MKKPLLLLLFILIFTNFALGQTSICQIKNDTFPALRGLKLDMPQADVSKIYPSLAVMGKGNLAIGVIKKDDIQNSEFRKGVESVSLMFNENKVFSIIIDYDSSISWSSTKEFADKIGESLSLPANAWQTSTDSRVMNCSDFAVIAKVGANSRAQLFVSRDPRILVKGKQQEKESFKP